MLVGFLKEGNFTLPSYFDSYSTSGIFHGIQTLLFLVSGAFWHPWSWAEAFLQHPSGWSEHVILARAHCSCKCWMGSNSQTLLMCPVFLHIFVVVPRTVLLMKRERLGLSSPSLQNTLSNRQRSHSRQKSTILTSMKRVRCVCQSLALKTGNRPQKLTKVRDAILPSR